MKRHIGLSVAALVLLAGLAASPAPARQGASQTALASKLVDQGDKLEDKDDQLGAIALYSKAIALDPDYAYAYASRCQSEWELDDNASAQRDCLRATKLDPYSAYAYRGLALAEGDLGHLDTALAAINRSIGLDPSRAFSYVARCRIRTDREEYGQAIADCNRGIEMRPKVAMGHSERTRAELGDSQWDAAVDDATWVIAHDPSETSGYYNRALGRLHTFDLGGAKSDIDVYIERYPDRGKGYYARARIELAQLSPQAALADARKALRLYQAATDSEGARKAQNFIDENASASTGLAALAGVMIVFGAIAWVLVSILWIVALWRVFERAGFQGTLSLIALIPLGVFICLGILAFSKWEIPPRPAPARSPASP